MEIKLDKVHILVVEDLTPMQQIMKDLLLSLGVGKVSLANNGIDGYQKYCREKPDMIITDWHMPEMDGLQFTRKIRTSKNSPNRTIPILMMTGYCSPGRISRSRDVGVTEFIAKPFTAKNLAKRIEHLIKSPRHFIITPQFVGPDRRRKKMDIPKGQSSRKQETKKKILASTSLQNKTGYGHINKKAVEGSQSVLDNNTINFAPLAQKFLNELNRVLTETKTIKNEDNYTESVKQNITDPIMQLKANGIIFKYDLVGNLSKVALDFLENTVEMNEYVLEITEAYYNTTKHIISRNNKGNGGDIGKALETELQSACTRYQHARANIMKNKLRRHGQRNS